MMFVLFIWMIFTSTSSTWSTSINGILNTRSVLPKTVRKSTDLVESIATGAQIAMNECQRVFHWDLWNCPESAFSRAKQHSPTKELAYTRAIVSAGIMHTITRNCSRGQIQGCGCDPLLGNQIPLPLTGTEIDQAEFNKTLPLKKGEKVTWSWGGCSDNVQFGEMIAKSYLDELEEVNDPQALMNLHNNEIGREAVRQSMVKRCRCHGVSGSCTLQTCWMQVAPFSGISKRLREMYDHALQIDVTNKISNNPTLVDDHHHAATTLPIIALVYLEQSPNYCQANQTMQWQGARGRTCSRRKLDAASVSEKKSCRNICRQCGLKVRKQRRTISVRCNCKFKWCCEVTCETCTQTIEEYHCE